MRPKGRALALDLTLPAEAQDLIRAALG